MPALFQIYQVFKDARFVPDLPSYQRCPLCSRSTKLSKMPALLVAALGYVRLLLAALGWSGSWLLQGSPGCSFLSVCNAPVMHTQSRTLSTSLVAWRFPVSSETMSVAMRGAQYLRSVFVWLDLDFSLWSAVLLDPHLSNDKSADLRARRWCLHEMGLRAIGGG